jgi:hypothetical protein
MTKYNGLNWVIKGIEYEEFSILKASEGGISQVNAIAILAKHGIKARRGAYTPYIGHYGLYVEAKFSDKAGELLFS